MAENQQRVVILGGGVASMATAWELTNQPDWQSRYDITLYQLGWRLGGKCASGRGPFGRIEEHGIHVLMGFYDNVFDILQSCYREMERPPGAPLATWEEAVAKQDNVVLMEDINGEWLPWQFKFKTNHKVPGNHNKRRHPHAILRDLLRQMLAIHLSSPLYHSPHSSAHRSLTNALGHQRKLRGALESLRASDEDPQITEEEKQELLDHLDGYICHLLDLPLVQKSLDVETTVPEDTTTEEGLHGLLSAAWHEAEHLMHGMATHIIDPILTKIRRAVIQLKLGYAMVRGILVDGVLTPHGWDFAAINNLDLRDWIAQNLAGLPGDHDETINSAPVRGIYDLVFAYRDGVPGQYALEAGTSLSFMLRIVFEYKGAIYWKMLAGMGDVVLAPMYLTLKKRGVKFEFFHSVRELKLSADGTSIGRIELGKQVNVKGDEYDPLFDVKGLPCFPAEPLYERLDISQAEEVELRALQAEFNGVESPWTTWKDRGTVPLEAGRDFDRVVLGISMGALPHICKELIAASASWQNMVGHIKTTATQSAQIWLKPDLEESGWEYGVCVLDAYAQPLNSWTDMSDLIGREAWPPEHEPGSIAYFTGPLPNQSVPPPYDEHAYAPEQFFAAHETSRSWLQENSAGIFPKAVVPGTGCLDFELLIDPKGGHGAQRFDSQYWRANVNPSDHYVLSVPGSSQYRLAAGNSGFSNLILAGDWTRNGMNAGSVEAAATSGILAAEALLETI